MNIESFNRELSKKIAVANSHEKRDELHDAINAWISISEMTLNVSKDPNIDNIYRRMLISKTEQILKHIKDLKVKLAIPNRVRKEEEVQDMIYVQENQNKIKSNENTTHKVGENPKNKGIPEGILEIKPSNDFMILTPHEELDKEILKEAKKIYKLDNDESESNREDQDNDSIIIEQPEDETKKICFACGTENTPNTKKCKSCNTELV